MDTAVRVGLEGVIAAETALSGVDGERGKLVIAGHDVEQLAFTASYEEAAAQLLGAAGHAREPGELARALGQARVAAWERLPRLGGALELADGMDALRAALAQLPARGDDAADCLAAIAGVAVFAAAWQRRASGQPPVAPDPERAHAADYLRMALGRVPSEAATRGLERYLVTVIDHGLNASTFAARVVASTGSDAISAFTAAIGALKGPLHGGAPGPVLDMLDAIGTPERAESWLRAELAAGRRIMGMGHRVYRVRDPRAAVLERALADLESPRLALGRAVETVARAVLRAHKPGRALAANVEFYTALLLDAVGLARSAFTPTFAVGRSAGYAAHVIEQRRKGRLIRPASRYIGAPALER